jgi:hypothetical protein
MNQSLSGGFGRFRPLNRGLTSSLHRYKERMLAVIVVVVVAWSVLAVGAALAIGAGIRVADRRAPFNDHLAGLPQNLTVDDILGVRASI